MTRPRADQKTKNVTEWWFTYTMITKDILPSRITPMLVESQKQYVCEKVTNFAPLEPSDKLRQWPQGITL
jgi:hypothetical protein